MPLRSNRFHRASRIHHGARGRHILYECGSCGQLHPVNWDGDCRDDSFRFASVEDYSDRTGIPYNQVTLAPRRGEE